MFDLIVPFGTHRGRSLLSYRLGFSGGHVLAVSRILSFLLRFCLTFLLASLSSQALENFFGKDGITDVVLELHVIRVECQIASLDSDDGLGQKSSRFSHVLRMHFRPAVQSRESLRQTDDCLELTNGDSVRCLRTWLAITPTQFHVRIHDFFLSFRRHSRFDCARVSDVTLKLLQRKINFHGGFTLLMQAHDVSSQRVVVELIRFIDHDVN